MDSTKALIAELHHLVSLNEERNGGPYQGFAAARCVEAMRNAAAALSAQGEAAQPAAEGWREVATVIWYDPTLDPFPPRGPHKIIDASIAFMDDAPLGTKLYVPASQGGTE